MEAIATQGRSYGNLFVGACLSRDGEGGVGKVWVLGPPRRIFDFLLAVGALACRREGGLERSPF